MSDSEPLVTTGVLAAVLVAAWLLGRLGGRIRGKDALDPSAVRISDASLALMGLLLGFTFAMALGKHDRRREMVVQDSNSIGDFYTCVSILADPAVREPLLQVTREYAERRLDMAKNPPDAEAFERELKQIAATHNRMTELVAQAVNQGTPVTIPLVQTLNNLTSNHATRLMTASDRLPTSIVGLLCLATVLSSGFLGWQQGAAGKSFPVPTLFFILLVSAVVYITLDLNQPRRGFIRVSQDSMERLIASMK